MTNFYKLLSSRLCLCLEGHRFWVRHKPDWGGGFILILLRLQYDPDQIVAVMVLSQHWVLSYRTIRPRAPYGARRMENAVKTWSTVCSMAPHMQFGEGVRPCLGMDE